MAMGSPLSPVLANLFIEEFERKALHTAPHRPKFWGRYVDDTGVVNRQEHEQELFDHINTQHDSIKFTIEREQNNRLPMLDVMMVRNPDNTITTDVFRKETHTDHYLQWSSNHPVQQKLGIVRTLMHRANTLIEDHALREAEKEKVRVALRHCGYPEWALREVDNNSRKGKSNKEQSNTAKQEKLPASYLVLPYIHGVTERLKRVYAKHNVSLYSKPGFTLRNALVRPNDPLAPSEKCGVIYKIKFEECGEVYIVVNNEIALSVATELQVITSQAETLSSSDVTEIIKIVQKIVIGNATEQIGDSILTTVENLLKVNATVLQQSQQEMRGPTRAVQALETFADTVILTTDTYTAVRPGVALQATDISPEELDKGHGFAFFLSGNDSTSLTEGNVTSFTTEDGGVIQQTADVSILLPPNLSSMIEIKNMSEVRLSYTLYNSSKLFVQPSQGAVGPSQGAVGPSQGSVATRIIGGRIAGRRVKNLPEPVIITFAPLQSFLPGVRCVFWDFEAEAGQGAWSTEGCESMGETKGRHTCACNHLTNFAAIFDVSGEGFGDHEKPLEVITIVGCVVSIVCLVLTLLAFIVTRKYELRVGERHQRRTKTSHAKDQPIVLTNLCVALLAILVIFLAGINRTGSPIVCKVVAALLHYFLLAALMWMAVEAINVYRAVVQVFDSVSGHFLIKAGAVAWGFPLVTVLSTVGPSGFYQYRMEKFCWLAREPLTYAFLIPAGLILLFNLLVFLLVMYKLVRNEEKRKELRGADANEVDHQWIARQIRRSCSIMALFGLTWLFGFFVIDDTRTVFAYLFCIFNTLQGLFIFIFHCVMRADMKAWWKKHICMAKKNQDQTVSFEMDTKCSARETPQPVSIELSPLKPNPGPL
ncbi:PREDICTED: adhesion G-protein coupled receptor G7-like [Branchiostoma belcheri]|uniref:Adhesion G-protein coupled receptor G7-like n=1 Tax=Branchiostoma belcheri TaxID=7741 RepID=A0A6P4Y4H2_BRABE|nr:PREDICTED: adhesion G-protein coupled receptor G7-like [Branchiostoma belcheri]